MDSLLGISELLKEIKAGLLKTAWEQGFKDGLIVGALGVLVVFVAILLYRSKS